MTNNEELRQVIEEISAYSAFLSHEMRNIFWKQDKYVTPNLKLAHRVNQLTEAGRLPSHAVQGAIRQLAHDMGLYPIKIDAQRVIHIPYEHLIDARDAVKHIYEAQVAEQKRQEDLAAEQAKLIPPNQTAIV